MAQSEKNRCHGSRVRESTRHRPKAVKREEAIDTAAARIIDAVPFIQSFELKYETWNQGDKRSEIGDKSPHSFRLMQK